MIPYLILEKNLSTLECYQSRIYFGNYIAPACTEVFFFCLLFPNGPQCSSMVLNGPQYSSMFLNGPQCSSMFLNGPQCSSVVLTVSQCSSLVLNQLTPSTFFCSSYAIWPSTDNNVDRCFQKHFSLKEWNLQMKICLSFFRKEKFNRRSDLWPCNTAQSPDGVCD